MATLARRLFKTALFIGLFLLSVRCIGRNGVMPESEALRWLSIAQSLGLHEADDVYIPAMLVFDLLAATLAYLTLTKLWKDLSVISWAGHIMRCKSHGYADEEEKTNRSASGSGPRAAA
ncbi:hypothetical protein, partial [Burkholderia sp. SIMBA_062]|uniref:hypothetical protein n=1 Tax=Burkholderia sp. SIMBA_062 TaxID=3085803 RepID=UPI00397A2769